MVVHPKQFEYNEFVLYSGANGTIISRGKTFYFVTNMYYNNIHFFIFGFFVIHSS